nr:hypothetical protein [uncultured Chitinophaga sp.]
MGQGTTLKIYNATPLALTQSSQHEYQMNDWSPPQTINGIQSSSYYVEWAEPFFSTKNPGDDGADVHYSLGDTTQTLWIMARAQNQANGTSFWLQFQSGWDSSKTGPSTSPYYLFSTTSNAVWALLNSNTQLIAYPSGDNPTSVLKIIQIDHFCSSEQETQQVLAAVINDQQSSPIFQTFIGKVNNTMQW